MACIWGAGFPVSKIGIQIIGAWPFRFLSALTGVIFLFLIFHRDIIKNTPKISKRDFACLLVIAIPSVYLVPVLNNISLEVISVTDATFLIYTMPCFTSIINLVIERKIDYISAISVLLCASGVALVIGETSFSPGVFIILSSALSWSIGSILSQRITTEVPFKAKAFWQVFFGSIFVLITSPFFVELDLKEAAFPAGSLLPLVFSVLFMGVIGGGLVFYIWFYLIKLQSAEYASYATLFSPIVSTLIAVIFMGENPTYISITGFAFILSSALCVNFIKPAQAKKKSALQVEENAK